MKNYSTFSFNTFHLNIFHLTSFINLFTFLIDAFSSRLSLCK